MRYQSNRASSARYKGIESTMRSYVVGILAVVLLANENASAHTKAIGYCNTAPGSVTFWFQSWHLCGNGPALEGSLNLVGINGNTYPSTTVPFTLSTCIKPPCLIDGVNNFYACVSNFYGLCVTDEDQPTGGTKWQGVTMDNLTCGEYQFTYIPIDNPSEDWTPHTDGVLTNTFLLGVEPPAGLISWWPLDKTSDPIAFDISGGHDGAFAFGLPLYSEGRVADSLRFPYPPFPHPYETIVPDYSDLDFGLDQDFSIDAWVKNEDLIDRDLNVASKMGWPPASTSGYRFYLTGGPPQLLALDLSDGVNYDTYVATDGIQNGNQDWHFVAMTLDRDNSQGLKLYLDGQCVSTLDATAMNVDLSNALPLHLGPEPFLESALFRLDEVEIFNRVLTPTEVYDMCFSGKCRDCGPIHDDSSEDNDTCNQAITLAPFTTWSNLFVSKWDRDWYHMVVPAQQALHVNVLFSHASGDINIRLYTSCGGSWLVAGNSADDDEMLKFLNLSTMNRDVFLEVRIDDAVQECNSYSFGWHTGPLRRIRRR